MLRQVHVLKESEIIYKRMLGNALADSEVENACFKIKSMAMKEMNKEMGYYDYYNYRIAYETELSRDLIFIFVSGQMDDYFSRVKPELARFKEEFLTLFKNQEVKLDPSKSQILDSIVDETHKNLHPKISLVGFSGVGKTTIKNLIQLEVIPQIHVPTITGDIVTVKIGKLFFRLFDFAGQDEYKFLWKRFLEGSDAVLLVTDSTIDNIEKSKYFAELIKTEVPHARAAVIGNKQDLSDAMSIETIARSLKMKIYPMVANRKENRDKMIRIIADLLDMNVENNPLLNPVFDREELMHGSEVSHSEALLAQMGSSRELISAGEFDDVKTRPPQEEPPSLSARYEDVEVSGAPLEVKIEELKNKLRDEIEETRLKKRLLGILKARKEVRIEYIKRFLKISSEKIIELIFELIGNGEIEGEFNDDETEFILH